MGGTEQDTSKKLYNYTDIFRFIHKLPTIQMYCQITIFNKLLYINSTVLLNCYLSND